MRICLVYDCLFPWTIGGGERWYRNLAERLAAEGHQITYLTLRQWREPPQIEGVTVIAVGPQMALYRNGKRRSLPPLRFGLGVFFHLLRHGRRYDIVHTASFPFFSLLAAAVAQRVSGYRIVCDWFEVWSNEYWAEYLGSLGRIGVFVQWLCARVRQKAYTFSRLHEERVRALGVKTVSQLTGLYAPAKSPIAQAEAATLPTVVYAGQFIPEKRIELIVEALNLARDHIPGLRAKLIGDGPSRPDVLAQIDRLELGGMVSCPGFVEWEVVDEAMASALCVVQPSMREGYGMVVIEAAHRGVPSIVVTAPDNAATELVSDGTNGFVVSRPEAALLAEAIVKCVAQSTGLRSRTHDWYLENEKRLSIEASLAVVVRDYRAGFLDKPTKSLESAPC